MVTLGFNFINQSFEVVSLKRVSKHTITRIGIWKNSIVSGDIKGNISSFSLGEANNIHRKHLGNDLSAIFSKPEVGALGGLVLYTSRGVCTITAKSNLSSFRYNLM